MEILLLGNGFDLYHKLPTKYENFLHTVCFLEKKYNKSMNTIGKIFSDVRLQNTDKLITESYSLYKEAYDNISIDVDLIVKLIELGETNIWFSYLLSSFNTDLGWIDFEKEISNVIREFNSFFENGTDCTTIQIALQPSSNMQIHVLRKFDFFHESVRSTIPTVGAFYRNVKKEYILEEPFGSENYVINKERIIETLYKQLCELSEMLKLYLLCFVEPLIECGQNSSSFNLISDIGWADYIFNLNYTHTYERLYKKREIIHIHGNVLEKIVLGVNQDDTDELINLNTDFIFFKKYYQRVCFKTDIEYLKAVSNIYWNKKHEHEVVLKVIGHSLDVTDKEIIKDLFETANKIKIFYHSEQAMGNYVKNLVSIYGKSGFDVLQKEKMLEFVELK